MHVACLVSAVLHLPALEIPYRLPNTPSSCHHSHTTHQQCQLFSLEIAYRRSNTPSSCHYSHNPPAMQTFAPTPSLYMLCLSSTGSIKRLNQHALHELFACPAVFYHRAVMSLQKPPHKLQFCTSPFPHLMHAGHCHTSLTLTPVPPTDCCSKERIAFAIPLKITLLSGAPF